MTNDKKLHEEKLLLSLNHNLKLHITLKDGIWRNGYVKEILADFFMFEDAVTGLDPIFFLEIIKIEPYTEEKKEEGK